MARRRVRSGGEQKRAGPREVDRRESKILAPRTHEDLGLDEEETWHKDRDKILLENDRVEEGSEDEEVFALKGIAESDDEDLDQAYDDADEAGDSDAAEPPAPSKKAARTQIKAKSSKAAPKQPGFASSSEEEEESEEETWGTKKSAYYTAPGEEGDSSDEEARKLETEEARRLQRRGREGLGEGDFGLGHGDDDDAAEEDDAATDEPRPVAARKMELPKDKEGLRRYLELNSPETLALAREWADVVPRLSDIQRRISTQTDTHPALLGLFHTHHQVLQTYCTALAFYLHLRASLAYAQQPQLLAGHPIMERLLELKQLVHVMESYNFAADDALRTGEALGEGEAGSEEDGGEEGEAMDGTWEMRKRLGLEEGELEALLREASNLGEADREKEVLAWEGTKRGGKSKVPAKETAKVKTNGKVSKEKEKKEKPKKKKSVSFELVQPEFVPSSTSRKQPATIPLGGEMGADSLAFGDPTSLSASDMSDKAARKKSLRFHTSRIASSALRRDAARKAREGGDEDIPYKTRRKELELREQAKAEERGKRRREEGGEGAELDGEEWGEGDKKRAREVLQGGSGDGEGEGREEEYLGLYETVERERKRRKVEKKERYEEERAAERFNPDQEDPSGPRSLTRQILTNRGLAPKRSKLARNPRVKKRVKFEKAQKRLASQKAVFKGGQAALGGEYSGEKSGISKRLVKSVKL